MTMASGQRLVMIKCDIDCDKNGGKDRGKYDT